MKSFFLDIIACVVTDCFFHPGVFVRVKGHLQYLELRGEITSKQEKLLNFMKQEQTEVYKK